MFFLIAMVELDGDDIRISSRGKMAERDIVQVSFVLCAFCIFLLPQKSHNHSDVVQFCPSFKNSTSGAFQCFGTLLAPLNTPKSAFFYIYIFYNI